MSRMAAALLIIDWFQHGERPVARTASPVRTVYNSRTNRYEDMSMAEFRQLASQGKIEEADAYTPYNGHDHKVFRLI